MSEEEQKWKKQLTKIKKNHPDCVPVFFMKHPEAPKHIKPPTTPFILFKQSFAIQQAMISLYQQIKTKGLYFFCPYLKENEVKYTVINPGPTIKSIYNQYGANGYLTLLYSDKQLGMQGLISMEKWMIRILVIVGLFWIILYGYSYYLSYNTPQNENQADL